MMEQQITKAIWTAIGLLIGFVGYYLKKRDARIDANDTSIKRIEKDYLSKKEFEKFDIDKIKANYVSREELEHTKEKLEVMMDKNNCKVMEKLERLDEKISSLNRDHIDKEEFLRHNSSMDDKINKITDMIVEIRKEMYCDNYEQR